VLTVVVLAYDEAASLEVVVREIAGELEALRCPHDILIIDDGSTDGTGQIADQLATMVAGVRVIHHSTNQGLGGGYRTGFASAHGEFVTFYPADGQFPASIIGQMLQLIGEADMVLGYLPNRDSSVVAKLLSSCERALYRLMFGKMPRFQGITMFRRSLLDEFELRSSGRGWAVLMELMIRACRADRRLVSTPTDMRRRMSGSSKVNNWRTVVANCRQILALRAYL
jgi:glycosyltransferase involved in cell wall biosynthesis